MSSSSQGRSRREFLAQWGALAAGGVGVPAWLGCSDESGESSGLASLTAAPRIDSHQHFWMYTAEAYSWIDPTSAVARDFSPSDLEPELAAAGFESTILVESRSDPSETGRLLGIAEQASFVRGVVGWLPLVDPNVEALIDQHAANPKLRGLRHAIAAEADPEFMFRDDFNRGIALLSGRGLRFDLLLVPGNLSRAPAFVDRHPNQIFVLDHVGKPFIKDRQIEPWRGDFVELSRRPNVYCKVSGLVNEADFENWQPSDFDPYLDTALEAFTPQRLMFGSDWPMCLMGTTYARWYQTATNWLATLSPAEQARILGGTALEASGS
jgi:L-fuconolactonase